MYKPWVRTVYTPKHACTSFHTKVFLKTNVRMCFPNGLDHSYTQLIVFEALPSGSRLVFCENVEYDVIINE